MNTQTVKPELKTLHLTLKKKWFEMIASGEKKEEYREIKPYWESRFIDPIAAYDASLSEFIYGKGMIEFDTIVFRHGYAKNAPTVTVECLGISIGPAKPEWSDNWQGNVFIIKLGELKGGDQDG